MRLTLFQASLWAGRGQNTVCPWQLYENEVSMSKHPQQSPPPMGNRNRPIVPSTVPAGPIARRGGAA